MADMGRHRKPKDPRNVAARRAVATVSVTSALGTGATLISAQSATAATGTVWDRLAQCESSGNFKNQDTGRNGHFGGFQFSPATWRGVGGTGNPANASIAEQLKRAKILLARSGPGQWECKVGLTKANGAAQGLTVLNGLGRAAPRSQSAPAVSSRAAKAVAFARAQLGKPYVFGGNGPGVWDCSGLVQAAWRAAGVSLPRVAADQFRAGNMINPAMIRPGDLVVYKNGGHIAMYVGNGQIIEAPRPGKNVQLAPFRKGWYADNFTAAVRVDGAGTQTRAPWPSALVPSAPKARPRAEPAPVPSTVAKAGTHKVVTGEWLAKIADRHNTRGGWPTLYALNKDTIGSDPDLIHAGQLIRLR